jgi:hypothetical protein
MPALLALIQVCMNKEQHQAEELARQGNPKGQCDYRVLKLRPGADHYYPALRTLSLALRKDSFKSRWNRYAHQQAAILQHSVIDSFGGGIR